MQVHWFYRPNILPVKIDECLQKLRGSFNQTMKNVIFGDNQNIGKIDQSFYLLQSEISSNFQRFYEEFIGELTPGELQSYTAVFTNVVEQERSKLQTLYSPFNLTNIRQQQFQLLFKTIKLSIYDELRPVRKAVNSDSKSKSCWTDYKPIICKMVEAAGVKIDEILKFEARRLQRDIDSITGAAERSEQIVQSAYARCADENSARTRKCVAFSVSGVEMFFSSFSLFGFPSFFVCIFR